MIETQAKAQPQGIESILQALAVGGQPTGQLGKLPSPINPQAILAAQAGGMPAGPPGVGAMESAGMVDPLQAALAEANPTQVQMILEALLRSGAFNQAGMPV